MVKPNDRNNIGTVTSIDDAAGQVDVEFVSTAGRTAHRTFDWDTLTIIEPKHPAARTLSPDATAALDRIVDGHQSIIDQWNTVLADHNVAPEDPHIYRRAVAVHIDRAAADMAAGQPDWLTSALSQRPIAPAAAQVWDDAVRNVAAYRSRHSITSDTSPLGPPPADSVELSAWMTSADELLDAGAWLQANGTVETITPRVRTAMEISERRKVLDAIIAAAPADQRHAIDALVGGQLSLDDTTDVLRDALAQQGDRRRWILEHWPHIVESVELDSLAVDDFDELPLPVADFVLELD